MKRLKDLERLQRIHFFIVNECTGTPKELALKLRISERLLYNLLGCLRDLDAKICYNRSRKTYYYKEDFQLQIEIAVSVINNGHTTKIFTTFSKAL